MPVDIDAVVLSNDRLSPEYNVVGIAAPEIATQSRPGQFVMVKCSADSEPLLRRPFSIFEVLRDDGGEIRGLSLLNKSVGVVTRKLFALEPGQRLRCLGPLGQPFSVATPPGAAWMVAGGVGLAPFLTLAETLRARATATTLFYGGRSSGDLYYLDRFEQLGVRLFLTTEDGSRGEEGFVTTPLIRELETTSANPPVTVYACGPTGMMRAVAAVADKYQRVSEVSLEQVMGCGLGGCYSCVVPVRLNSGASHFVRSCLDGPVFAGDQIVWSELV
jgi:dihydroorotate dehydrogenase electron transfer subunit